MVVWNFGTKVFLLNLLNLKALLYGIVPVKGRYSIQVVKKNIQAVFDLQNWEVEVIVFYDIRVVNTEIWEDT